MKAYLIEWGFYTCNNGGMEIEAIYNTREDALIHIQKSHNFNKLKQIKSKQTKELIDNWSDGDYWIGITEIYINSPSLWMSREEYEKLR